MILTPEDRSALAAEIAEQLTAMQSPVLTDKQAMAMTGKTTRHSFMSWRNKYAKTARVGEGRYSRDKIVQGLNRESKQVASRRGKKASV
jgi:hypothetical protein